MAHHLKISTKLSPTGKLWFLLQKEIVLLTTCSHKSQWEKVLSLQLTLIYLYNKAKLLGCPKVTLGLPQCFHSQNFSISECSYIIRYITFKTKFNKTFSWRGPRLIIDELFPRLSLYCYAFKIWRFKKTDVYFVFCSLIPNHLYSCWTQS